MKKILICALFLAGLLAAQDMSNFCAAPPFVGGKNSIVIPNVLLVQDMTGSMAYLAYYYHFTGGGNDTTYDSTRVYYGYADPPSKYSRVTYGGSYYFQKNPAGPYLGNKINYYFMDRIDIARKAFTGGKGPAYNDKSRLIFETRRNQNGHHGFDSNTYYGIITTDSTERTKGIIREISDKDNNYVWDAGAPHFALEVFSTASAFGRKIVCPFGSTLISMLNYYENQSPSSGTNCSDAIFEAIHYLAYVHPYWGTDYTWLPSMVGTPSDPWYEVVGGDTVTVSCRPTFCIITGDGGSNSDTPNINTDPYLPWSASPYGVTHPYYWNYDYDYDYAGAGGIDPYDDCSGPTWSHTRPGDDYAYYAHINDLRPDADPIYGVPDTQTVSFYTIYLFARGEDDDADSIFFRKVAMHGGFRDSIGDTVGTPGWRKPDKRSEWDANGDGRPDNFFYVNNGSDLATALLNIFINIQTLTRMTSASAGAVTGSGTKGGAVIYNAQFFPKLPIGTKSLTWIGKASALWISPAGYIREETNSDLRLNLRTDYVVDMYFSYATNKTVAARYADTSGKEDPAKFVAIDVVAAESLRFLWDGAQLLKVRPAAARNIFSQNAGVRQLFRTDQAWIDPNLNIPSSTAAKCDSLISYVRGVDYAPNYRSRLCGSDVWKLGDIIHSSPMPVTSPSEAYNLIYGDGSYSTFYDRFVNRRNVIYAGANDGMIHAFNAGYCTPLGDTGNVARIDSVPPTLGEELWSFIPYNVLPHLQWLRDTSYCHVYYVDLKPYPTDIKVFTASNLHPEGWGTILLTGMGFGGGPITAGGTTYSSSYTCLDVTDPEYDGRQPQFLWEFVNDSLGFTLCVPAVAKVGTIASPTWYLVTGSGPQTLLGETTQRAKIYVIDPLTGALVGKLNVPDNNTAVINIFTADYGLNYTTNLIYFGTYDNTGGGKIYRILTHNDPDVNNWTMHEVINLKRPITAEGSVATDEKGSLWLYFGTGKYLANPDVGNTQIQMFIGLKDDTARTTAFDTTMLLNVTRAKVFADSVSGIAGVHIFDQLVAKVDSIGGWYVKFDSAPGERCVTSPVIIGGAVLFTTFIPQDTTHGTVHGPDLCIGSGGGPQAGNLYALYYLTGTSYKNPMLGEDSTTGVYLTHERIMGDMPSEPSMHIGKNQEKTFIHSAGGLIGIQIPLPYNPRGNVMLWRGR
jgi:type IV pilus assembly protein PilY1